MHKEARKSHIRILYTNKNIRIVIIKEEILVLFRVIVKTHGFKGSTQNQYYT